MIREEILKAIKDIAIIGGSSSLHMRGLIDKEPKDLDLLCTQEKYNDVTNVLKRLGGLREFHILNLRGFHPTAQYSFANSSPGLTNYLKVDIFLVPENVPCGWIGDNKWVEPEVVWAARAFYAAKGFVKAKQQLVDGGFWLQEQSDNAQNEVREFDNYDDEDGLVEGNLDLDQ